MSAVPEADFQAAVIELAEIAGLARLPHARFARLAARVPGPDDGSCVRSLIFAELKSVKAERQPMNS